MTRLPAGTLMHAALLSLVAFFLHFGWEMAQCQVFYEHGTLEPTLANMVQATVGDVVITWVVFAVMAAGSKRWRWDRGPLTSRQWAGLVTLTVTIGVMVELHALSTGRWAYSALNPTVPGLGVSLVPLVQLAALTPLSVRIAGRTEVRLFGRCREDQTIGNVERGLE